MRYTHFVFDIDNTLINTTGAVLHGLQRALRWRRPINTSDSKALTWKSISGTWFPFP